MHKNRGSDISLHKTDTSQALIFNLHPDEEVLRFLIQALRQKNTFGCPRIGNTTPMLRRFRSANQRPLLPAQRALKS